MYMWLVSHAIAKKTTTHSHYNNQDLWKNVVDEI